MPTDRRIYDVIPQERRQKPPLQRKIYSRSEGVGASFPSTQAKPMTTVGQHLTSDNSAFHNMSTQTSSLHPQRLGQAPQQKAHLSQQRRHVQISHANSTSTAKINTSPSNQGYTYVPEFKWWRRLLNNKWAVTAGAFVLVSFIGFQALSIGSRDIDTPQVLSSTAGDSSQLAFGQTPNEELPSGAQIETYRVPASSPRMLRIPQLGVEHRIVELGVNELNILAPPANMHDIGWYAGSQAPGAPGAVLLNGYTRGPSLPGPLVQIETLTPGSVISIEMGDGSLVDYEIIEVREYPYEEIDMSAALLPIEPGRNGLNIMTFENESQDFNSSTARRLILFASEL